MNTMAQLGRLAAQQMMKSAGGEGLLSALKDFAANNSTALGAAGGGLLGAGAGYLLGDEEDRMRAALAGAGIGAGLGGVGGYAAGNRMAMHEGQSALAASIEDDFRVAARGRKDLADDLLNEVEYRAWMPVRRSETAAAGAALHNDAEIMASAGRKSVANPAGK